MRAIKKEKPRGGPLVHITHSEAGYSLFAERRNWRGIMRDVAVKMVAYLFVVVENTIL